MNKTERTTITRAPITTDENWRTVREVGPLLGASEDVQQRKHHATAAFKRFRRLWIHPNLLLETLCVRLYNMYVTYSAVQQWGLTDRDIAVLERITIITFAASSSSISPRTSATGICTSLVTLNRFEST